MNLTINTIGDFKMNTRIKLQKLNPNAILPSYGSDCAAGADLYACLSESISIAPGETYFVKTGIALEIPTGCVGLIYARSGLACKKGLAPANKVGVIDSDYRGEIMVALYNHSQTTICIEPEERIAQLVIMPYLTAIFEETTSLEDTNRGEGGFGSTGRK